MLVRSSLCFIGFLSDDRVNYLLMISAEPYGGTGGADDVVEMHMQQALAFAQ